MTPYGLYSEGQAAGATKGALFGLRPRRVSNTIMRGGFLDTTRGVNAMNPFSAGLNRNNTLRRFRGSGANRMLTGMDEATMTGPRLGRRNFYW